MSIELETKVTYFVVEQLWAGHWSAEYTGPTEAQAREMMDFWSKQTSVNLEHHPLRLVKREDTILANVGDEPRP